MNKPQRARVSAPSTAGQDGTQAAPSRATKAPSAAALRRPAAAAANTAARAATPPSKAAPTKAPPKPKVTAKAALPKPPAAKKMKLVKGEFTMAESEFKILSELKKACSGAGFAVKKNDLVRAAVVLLRSLNHDALKHAMDGLTPLKTAGKKKSG